MQRHFTTFAASLVVILGIFNLPSGLTLMGAASSVIPDGSSLGDVEFTEGKQIVRMSVEGLEYAPHKFKIKQGIPVEWVIDGRSAEGCAQVITAPSLGVSKMLSKDKDMTLTFTPNKPGAIPFHCSMGMAKKGAQFEVLTNTELKNEVLFTGKT